ncbi:putative Ig domain-containing protein, partial [Photobacterium makurazakiensis]|uniref:putative Ig domain-containing protein n=1 Tax=Photobacterium makurazakiensis TaxID=2910234 RepID=UPI003D14D6AF
MDCRQYFGQVGSALSNLLFILILILSGTVATANAMTLGTSDGTYDFGNLGGTGSGGAGFKTQGDKFIVSNDFRSFDGVIYLSNESDGILTSTVVFQAEGGSTMKSATVINLSIASYAGTTTLTQFDITLSDMSNNVIASHQFSGSQNVGTSNVTLSDFAFDNLIWPSSGYDNVSKIEITYTSEKATNNFEFRNITLANISAEIISINTPPVISGSPATSVNQGASYSFTPVASDIDNDDLTFSIENQPAWSSFSSASGVLSGLPTNSDVGTTSNIVIKVSDGTETVSLAAFNLAVVNVNDAPTISGSPATLVNQDAAYSFSPSASDVDNDDLAFSIENQPAWTNFHPGTGVLSGLPTNSDVGTSSNIVISVSDGIETASLPAFNLTVVNINDAPTISGSPATSVNQDAVYIFSPSYSDADSDDLIFSIENQPRWTNFNPGTGVLSGLPTNSDIGTSSNIVISVSDGIENASLPAFNLEVVNVNDAPTISGSPATSVNQDAVYSFSPSYSDADSDDLTFSIENQPAWTNFNPATGVLSGLPTNSDVGTSSNIVISVSDGIEIASLAAFNLEVVNINDAPTISGAPATTVNQDAVYSFSPSYSDADSDDLTFSIANQPAWTNFNPGTGVLSGLPTNSDVGTSSNIVISVSDGIENASLPAFNLEVVNVNDAPTISGTPATSVNQDAVYSFSPSYSDADSDDLTFSIENQPAWTNFNPATGLLSGLPNNGDVGTSSNIVISVSDGTETVSLQAFNLEVVNVNDAPTISGSPATSVNQDAVYSFSPSYSDADSDDLTFSIENQPSWTNFNPATGVLSGLPNNGDVGTSSNIVISVSDGIETASLAAFNLEVVNVNDAPTISGSPATSVNQDVVYSFSPSYSDADSDDLTFSIENQPSWTNFNPATGVLSGLPNNDDVGITSNIVIKVSDGTETVSLAAFNLEVVNINDAPVISGTPATSVNQDAVYSFSPSANDADSDDLAFSIENQPSWANFNPATGVLSGLPTNGDVGTSSNIVISVSDGIETASLAAFNLEVVNVNDAPTISGSSATSVNQDAAYSFSPTVNDVDSDDLTFSIENQPSWTNFNPATGLLSGLPTNGDVGTSSNIVISVSDGIETASLAAFNLEVVNVNDAPVISGSPATTVNQDAVYNFSPSYSDADSDDLTFSIENQPSWTNFNPGTGVLSGQPNNDDVGTSSNIVISVSDGTETASLAAFNLEVVNVNDAPVISGSPATTVNQDAVYSFSPSYSDADSDDLTFSIENQPVWASFSSASGVLSGLPTNGDVGTSSNIVISVSDGIETVSLAAFSLEVVNVNDAPVISGSPATSVNEDSAYTFTPSVNDVDEDDSHSFSITGKPSWAGFDTATGTLSGTPTNDDVGQYSDIVITVKDSAEASDALAAFGIGVGNTNDAPEISGTPATSVNEDSAYTFTPSVNDVDEDDSHSFSITGKPSWAGFDTATGTLSGTPTNDDVGQYSDIVIAVKDSAEASDALAAFGIDVGNTNDAPTISGTPATSVNEDSAYTFTPSVNDVDEDDSHSFSITGKPSWAGFDTATGTLSGTPTNDDVGQYSDIVIAVKDSAESSDTLAAFGISVGNTNDAPEISGTPATSVNEDSAYTFTPSVNDVDEDDSHSFSITGKPSWAGFDTATGTLSGTPTNDDVGQYSDIVIAVKDSAEASDALAAFGIDVGNTNDAPTISGTPATSVNEDSAYTFTPSVN